jgi:hypothetical protein
MSDSTLTAPGFLRRGPAVQEEPRRRVRLFGPRESAPDANTASPQQLTPEQRAHVDEHLGRLEPRVAAVPYSPDPLSPEVAALVPRGMVEKAKAFREETLASYQGRIDNTRAKYEAQLARDEAHYAEADRLTAAMVAVANKMAVEIAQHIGKTNEMEADLRAASDGSMASLRAVAEKHVPHAVTTQAESQPTKSELADLRRRDMEAGLREAAEALGPKESPPESAG